MSAPVKYRRRTYIVQADFQIGFILKSCALILIPPAAMIAVLYWTCGTTVTTVFQNSRLQIVSTLDFLMPHLQVGVIISIGIAILACVCMTLIISNRLVGPVFRLKKDIAKMSEGDLTVQFYVRKKDELQILAKMINDMARDLQADMRALKGHVAQKDLDKAKAILEKYKV